MNTVNNLRTAQVLPSLKATMKATAQIGAAQNDAAHDMCSKAIAMAKAAAPMYEGYMGVAALYAGIYGIMNSRVVEPGGE